MSSEVHANVDSEKLKIATEIVRQKLGTLPEIALILGSGLGPFADALEKAKVIKTTEIPGYPPSTVPGHAGRWLVGELSGKQVVVVQGRIHGYEGHSAHVVSWPIHVLASCGVKKLVITNAAGAINRFFAPGHFMVIDDQINLSFSNPLIGQNDEAVGARFPDMSAPFDRDFSQQALEIGLQLGVPIHRGVYVGVQGPSYETAAEIGMYDRLGADAVGMSTVAEVLAAVYRGIRILGISCISNMATGISKTTLSHGEVTEVAHRVQNGFTQLLRGLVGKM